VAGFGCAMADGSRQKNRVATARRRAGRSKKGMGGNVQEAGDVFQVYDKEFAHCDAIVILTLVAYA
jgi:hypothetical protein